LDCPVGRFIEFYGAQRLVAERVLGLRPVYLPRAGYGFAVGFPRRLAYEYARRAMQAGLAVLLVGAGASTLLRVECDALIDEALGLAVGG
jgi:hypothetical protein